MTAKQYAKKVIATALHNGMTIEQIQAVNPSELARAHLAAQSNAIKDAGEKILFAQDRIFTRDGNQADI